MARLFAQLIPAAIAFPLIACGSAPTPSSVPSPPPPPSSPQCDSTLWPHVHDPKRLAIKSACITVTGTLIESHSSDDGDIDMDLDVDPQYKNLLNQGNLTKTGGYLHIEAICQATVHPDVPAAMVSCADFHGTVPIPPNGAYVQVTGVYLEDNDHGYMEIHPISVMTTLR